MAAWFKSGVKAHDDAVQSALVTLQSAVVPGASQSTITAAEIAYYRAVKASCLANNNGSGVATAITALRCLAASRQRQAGQVDIRFTARTNVLYRGVHWPFPFLISVVLR